jgi:hypothetical protein
VTISPCSPYHYEKKSFISDKIFRRRFESAELDRPVGQRVSSDRIADERAVFNPGRPAIAQDWGHMTVPSSRAPPPFVLFCALSRQFNLDGHKGAQQGTKELMSRPCSIPEDLTAQALGYMTVRSSREPRSFATFATFC